MNHTAFQGAAEWLLRRIHAFLGRWGAPLMLGLLLGACGGGGSGGDTTSAPPAADPLVFGTAANGAGLDGTVSLQDSKGQVLTAPISGASGQFSLSVKGLAAPFMLKATSADGQVVLWGAAPVAGRANVTPFTTLALVRLATQFGMNGPADLYAAPDNFAGRLTSNALAAAATESLTRLLPAVVKSLPGTSADGTPAYDPFGTAYTVGDAVDRLLDGNPISFARDASGLVTVTQLDAATGARYQVARSDTIAAAAKSLAIPDVGDVVAGTTLRFSAEARFDGGATQTVPAQWQVTSGGGSIDAAGTFTPPALVTAGTVTVHARWSDGVRLFEADRTVNVLPAMRPLGLDIDGVPAGAASADSDLVLTVRVRWSDGSSTQVLAVWNWTGDASAIQTFGVDGRLHTGRPSSNQAMVLSASYSANGITVQAQAAMTVARFVRRIVSATITGANAGQTLMAGDRVRLALAAQWNDGSETVIAPTTWSVAPVVGSSARIAASIDAAGLLTTPLYYVGTGASDAQRAAEQDLVTATYDDGTGSSATATLALGVQPLVNKPVSLQVFGPHSLFESATGQWQAQVTFADGSTAPASPQWSSSDPMLAPGSGPAGTMFAGRYASEPTSNAIVTLTAAESFSYVEDGKDVVVQLSASTDVEITWVVPKLRSIDVAWTFDFLLPGQPTQAPVVTGTFLRLDERYSQTIEAAFSADSELVTSSGNVITASAPTSAGATWVTLTATAHDPAGGADMTLSRTITVDLAGTVPKHLLPQAWGPADPEVQFRAIASDGHVDDYTVARIPPRMLGMDLPVTRRRLPFFTGVTAFAQSVPNSSSDTVYVAAIESGQVVVMRLTDLRDYWRSVRPVALANVSNALELGFTTEDSDPQGVRLVVRDSTGAVTWFGLPMDARGALRAADISAGTRLAGTWGGIATGRARLILVDAQGAPFVEGDGYPDLGTADYANHWDAPAPLRQQLDIQGQSYAAITGVTRVWASFNTTIVATGNALCYAGRSKGPFFSGYPGTVCASILSAPPRGAAWGVVLLADGSIQYQTVTFFDPTTDDFFGGGIVPSWTPASGLPPALEVVDGRRVPAADTLYFGNDDSIQGNMLPIFRGTDDRLFYLNGWQITDSSGQPLVLL